MAPNLDPCTPDDIGATIFNQFGVQSDTETKARPIQLFREGKVVEKLIG